MQVERWRRIEALLGEALELPEAERIPHLETTCRGDATLVREVARLLAADRAATGFLERPPLADLEAALAAGAAAPPADDLPRGTIVGRYRIEEKIGEGGMGAVYAAHDPDLDRRVALKLLRLDAPAGASHRRLLREAQALARVAHPHVVAVFDVGRHGEAVFLAMELVAGGTLADWLATEQRGWREIVAAFTAAARGLAAAHAAGIVHRDFKPANVLRDGDGRFRVADFGLARTAGEETAGPEPGEGVSSPLRPRSFDSSLTASGWTIGTPTYMAPEQHLGGVVGPASDQFAFCVALFQAVYGAHPFAAPSVNASQARRLAGEVGAAPRGSGVPHWLRRALLRGLDVEPERRWPSMGELADLLEQGTRRRPWRRAAAAVAAPVVVAALLVLATDRRAAPASPPTGGSPPPAAGAAAGRGTASLQAYGLYRRGREHWNRRTPEGLRTAVRYFEQALDQDPDYALAYAGIADAYVWMPDYDPAAPADSLERALAAARRAVELAPLSAETHASYGMVLAARGALDEAEARLRRSAELGPGYATAHHWLGAFLLRERSRLREGVAALERARQLDPSSSVIAAMLAAGYDQIGRHDRALATRLELRELDPEWRSGPDCFARSDLVTGRRRQAIAAIEALGEEANAACRAVLAEAHHMEGDYAAELAVARQALRDHPRHYMLLEAEGGALAALGRLDEVERHFDRILASAEPGARWWYSLFNVLGELRVHGHGRAARHQAERLAAWIRRHPAPEMTGFAEIEPLGYALLEAGRSGEADRVLGGWLGSASGGERWATQLPEPYLLGLEGWLAARAGREERARDRLRRLAALETPSEIAPFAAMIHHELGEPTAAVRAFERRLDDGLALNRELHVHLGLDPLRSQPELAAATAGVL